MQIEEYFYNLQETIKKCLVIHLTFLTFEKRGTHEGFIKGSIHFVDGSILYMREFVDVEIIIDRLMYAYQFQDSSKKPVFRYDNSGHYKKLKMQTYPHHKHDFDKNKILPSVEPDLSTILQEIESIVLLPEDID